MQQNRLDEYHNWTLDILDNIPKIIAKIQEQDIEVEEKQGPRDLVTKVDKSIEDYITRQIKQHFPTHRVMGEETYHELDKNDESLLNANHLWVIDPIDGTSNFVGQNADYATLIAYFEEGQAMLSYIYLPDKHDLYYAIKGQGVHFNEHLLDKPKDKRLQESVVSFDLHRIYDNRPELFEHVMTNAFQVRREGCSGVDGARVLEGRFTAFFSFAGGPWDFAPHFLFADELGLILRDLEGKKIDLSKSRGFYIGGRQCFEDIFGFPAE